MLARLKTEEGFRATKYLDSRGLETIGYGFNIDAGMSEPEAAALLVAQIDERMQALQAYPWFIDLDAVRQSVCLDIAINDGLHGLLEFVNLIAALVAQNWQGAHDELLDSDAARALPGRYGTLAQILLTGVA